MSETEVLAHEGADARQALFDTLDDLKGDLAQAADVRLWARQHPWATLGVAAAAGFALAAAITPRRNETVSERMNHLAGSFKSMVAAATDQDGESKRQTATATLVGKLFDLAKVALGNLILMAVQSKMNQYAAGGAPEQTDAQPQTAEAR